MNKTATKKTNMSRMKATAMMKAIMANTKADHRWHKQKQYVMFLFNTTMTGV